MLQFWEWIEPLGCRVLALEAGLEEYLRPVVRSRIGGLQKTSCPCGKPLK